MNITKFLSALLAFITITSVTQANATPTLFVNVHGLLVGAKNVDVAGTLYDVTFADGSCNSVFKNCSASAFAFNTFAAAQAAIPALLDQVFVDGKAGMFDTQPYKIRGCTAIDECWVFIPYMSDTEYVYGAAAINSSFSNDTALPYHGVGGFSALRDWNMVSELNVTYAIFTLAPNGIIDVPEPSSFGLMSIALAALAFVGRRKKS